MVIANECTRHICCSRKNSLSCAKSTSNGRHKNKLQAGSANAQINPAVTTWGRFISGSWCGLKRARQWRSWAGSKGLSHACLCHSITEYTVKVAPFSLSLGNDLGNRVELITSEVKGNWHSVLQPMEGLLKNTNDNRDSSPSAIGPQIPLAILSMYICESFADRVHLMFSIMQCTTCGGIWSSWEFMVFFSFLVRHYQLEIWG